MQLVFLFLEPACALFEIIAWHVFPEREKTCVDIYVDVFRAVTLANDLLNKALMKLSISMFDIWLPSQHLVFVFDAPKWLLMRPAPVPAIWNEKMLRRCTEPVAAVVTLLSGTQRALHLVVRLFASSNWLYFTHYNECLCQTLQACPCGCCRSDIPPFVCSF